MDPSERMRTASRRLAEPVEVLAQNVARHVIELVVEALDLNALLDQIDVNRLIERIDVDSIIARVDMQAVLSRVDVNELASQVDINTLASQIDLNTLASQVDLNALASQVDIDALLQRTDIEAVLSRSSTTIASEGIDLVRSQAVGLDDFLARWVYRIRRRRYAGPPAPLRLASSPQAES
jgi:hypothetical protein